MYVCSYLSLSLTFFPSHLPPLPVCPQVAEPLLPYALAFAGGAMVFVVVDDIIPEGHSWYVLLLYLVQLTRTMFHNGIGHYKNFPLIYL